MSEKPAKPIEIFYSYSHIDEELRDELEKHLSILKHQGVIQGWHDRRIGAGKEWEGEIDAHLNTAHVILLLISSDFLASDYCYDIEMERAMERHETGEARVIPVILRPVDWKGAPFGKLLALPTDAKPVTSWSNRDEAFLDVARGIRAAVEELASPVAGLPLQLPRAITESSDRVKWQLIGHAQDVAAMTAINGRLLAVTRANRLWIREPVHRDIPWRRIESIERADIEMVAVAVVDDKQLFAATKDDSLWMCEPFALETSWKHIGHAQHIVAMTAMNSRLFAVTRENRLWAREPVYRDIPWTRIERAERADIEIVAMATIGGKLFVATRDRCLWLCDPFASDISWKRIVQHIEDTKDIDIGIVAMAAIGDRLFAATENDQLLFGAP